MLTSVQLQVRDTAKRYSDGASRSGAEDLDRAGEFPEDLYREMAGLGLFEIGVPEPMGGPGFDTVANALVMEELYRGYVSVAGQRGLIEMVSTLLVRHGSCEQRARWLPGIHGAEIKVVAHCITESVAGTDVSGIRATANRDGAGLRLNGSKIWIHNAPVADLGNVLVRTTRKLAPGHVEHGRRPPFRRCRPRAERTESGSACQPDRVFDI